MVLIVGKILENRCETKLHVLKKENLKTVILINEYLCRQTVA